MHYQLFIDMTQYLEFASNHPLLVLAFFLNILLILYLEYSRKTALYTNIGASEATLLQNHKSAIFLDVREKSEYSQGHLLNAINIPTKKLTTELKQLSKHKNQPVIVYCTSGSRSITASKILTANEFNSVYNLKGGILAWQKSNLPVTKH